MYVIYGTYDHNLFYIWYFIAVSRNENSQTSDVKA